MIMILVGGFVYLCIYTFEHFQSGGVHAGMVSMAGVSFSFWHSQLGH